MLTKEQTQELINLKGFSKQSSCDADNIRIKEIIKQRLLGNNEYGKPEEKARTISNSQKIIHLLNNEELDEEEPDSYFGVNIQPFYVLNGITNEKVKNYICYETSCQCSDVDGSRFFKNMRIVFYVLCDIHDQNDIVKGVGIARHDLLAHLIQDEFNWSNCFGTQIVLIDDNPSITDSDYATRTLVFESNSTNNILHNNSVINTSIKR